MKKNELREMLMAEMVEAVDNGIINGKMVAILLMKILSDSGPTAFQLGLREDKDSGVAMDFHDKPCPCGDDKCKITFLDWEDEVYYNHIIREWEEKVYARLSSTFCKQNYRKLYR